MFLKNCIRRYLLRKNSNDFLGDELVIQGSFYGSYKVLFRHQDAKTRRMISKTILFFFMANTEKTLCLRAFVAILKLNNFQTPQTKESQAPILHSLQLL